MCMTTHTVQTHTHTHAKALFTQSSLNARQGHRSHSAHTHLHTKSELQCFLVLLGISQSPCHCQTTSIRPLKPSKPVWFTVSPSLPYSLFCSLSQSLFQKAKSAVAFPSYYTPKCSCPWFLFFCCSNLVAETRYSLILATGKAVDSCCDREPQSTSDKEVKI